MKKPNKPRTTPLTNPGPIPGVIGPDSDPPLAVRAQWAENITAWYFDAPVTDEEILAAWQAYQMRLHTGSGPGGERTPAEVRDYLVLFFTAWNGREDATALVWRDWLDTVDREGLADEVQRARVQGSVSYAPARMGDSKHPKKPGSKGPGAGRRRVARRRHAFGRDSAPER